LVILKQYNLPEIRDFFREYLLDYNEMKEPVYDIKKIVLKTLKAEMDAVSDMYWVGLNQKMNNYIDKRVWYDTAWNKKARNYGEIIGYKAFQRTGVSFADTPAPA
jgi:hypothetical protein